VFQHGFVEEPVIWTLDTDRRAEAPVHEARALNPATSRLCTCNVCSAVRTAGKPCPNCGHMPKRPGRDIEVFDGDLAHVSHNGRIQPNQYSPQQRYDFHRMLTGIAHQRGYKPGW